MTAIDFGVTRSKVKVTVTLNVKMFAADFLENLLSQSLHISHIDWSLLLDGLLLFKYFIINHSDLPAFVSALFNKKALNSEILNTCKKILHYHSLLVACLLIKKIS